ncbi:MAG: helix-turn-helix domain-containing protein, partial [Lactococcus lactis]|nr:helix-turn-helix domain-containing protein [Lactococcus lactis]
EKRNLLLIFRKFKYIIKLRILIGGDHMTATIEEKYTLKQLRTLRGYSREELARKSNVTSRTIYLYESDIKNLRNGKYSTIDKISKTLGVGISDIFLNPDSEKPKRIA